MKKSTTLCANRIIYLVIALIGIGIALTTAFYYFVYIEDYYEIPATIRITPNTASFNTSTTGLDFARNYPGGYTTKQIDIHADGYAHVIIKAKGNITTFMSIETQEFYLNDEIKSVTISMDIPQDAVLGQYEGVVQVYILRW